MKKMRTNHYFSQISLKIYKEGYNIMIRRSTKQEVTKANIDEPSARTLGYLK